MRVYNSLVSKDTSNRYGAEFHLAPEAPGLVGFMCGNTRHEGCLTTDESVRLHSCEKGNYCPTVQNAPVVWIQPIITHLPNGQDVAEMGIGGGGDDLERDAELDSLSPQEIQHLLQVCVLQHFRLNSPLADPQGRICDIDDIPDELKENIRAFLVNVVASGRNISLDLEMSSFGDRNEAMLETAIQAIAKKSQLGRGPPRPGPGDDPASLSRLITFPYSRHSSYPELCLLVGAFKPKDVWPCTVRPQEWAMDSISIKKLFGGYCSGTIFRHDVFMESLIDAGHSSQKDVDSQATDSSMGIPLAEPLPLNQATASTGAELLSATELARGVGLDQNTGSNAVQSADDHFSFQLRTPRERLLERAQQPVDDVLIEEESLQDSQGSAISQSTCEMRDEAFRSMIGNVRGQEWRHIGLISVSDNHTSLEDELGER